MEYSSNLALIIFDVHKLINKHRKKNGRKPLKFEDRTNYYMGNIVDETIANSGTPIENAPFCQCKPGCEKRVRRIPFGKVSKLGEDWNKYAHGHNPARGEKKASSSLLPSDFTFTTRVLEKKDYNQKIKIKDERVFSLLNQVNKGDTDEVTMIHLAEEQKKLMANTLKKAIKILNFPIDITVEHDHIALCKRS